MVTFCASAKRTAVPSGSRRGRANIVGRLLRHAIDRDVERLLEADDEHIAGLARRAVDIFARGEHQPRIAVVGGHSQRRLDRRGSGRRGGRWRGQRHDQTSKSGYGFAAIRNTAAKTRKLGGATARHKGLKTDSTELDRHPGGRAFAAMASSRCRPLFRNLRCCAYGA